MSGLDLEAALGAAMKVKPPAVTKARRKARRKPRKAK